MPVRYITVTPVTKLFKPATRAFGDVAVVGAADAKAAGPLLSPVPITNPDAVGFTRQTTLVADAKDTDTTLKVAAGAGFPAAPFEVRVDSKGADNKAVSEVVRVTTVANTDWTVVRGKGDTKAVAHAKGDLITYTARGLAVDDAALFKGDLGASVRLALEQSPGPTTVYAVRYDPTVTDGLKNALAAVAALDAQIVVLANTPLGAGKAAVEALAGHVGSVSTRGGDGKERIGVAMLPKGSTDVTLVTSAMSTDRMVAVAHNSAGDAAAATAGAIAGREPHISLLLKPVKVDADAEFTDAEIEAFDKARINWLTDPVLIPGRGTYLGEGYTLGAEMPYVDVVRTVDDVSFRLKAQLIQAIGDLRITRSGLRTLVSMMTAVLEPLRQREVIDGYDVFLPLLVLLDKAPADRTAAEDQMINDAQNARTVDAVATVDYAGAIHRLNISLVFK